MIVIEFPNMPEGKLKGVVITANGDIRHEAPENGKNYELAQLQKIVGGYIEIVRLPNAMIERMGHNLIMVVNEDGMYTCQHNLVVSDLFDYELYGDVLITSRRRVK